MYYSNPVRITPFIKMPINFLVYAFGTLHVPNA
jgi:hypothetical protein